MATQVARLYFDRELSKVEIAERLGISRFRVARLLRQARDTGLVRIEYRDQVERDLALARAIERRFDVDLCVVAAGPGTGTATARVAAEVMGELVCDGMTVGVAWGSTLGAVADQLRPRRLRGATVVPLAGGSSRIDRDRTPAELTRRVAERLGAAHRDLFAPAFLASAPLRDALVAEPEVEAVLATYGRLDVAVVGIGAWTDDAAASGSSLVAAGVLDASELRALRRRGAVGELVVHPFDAHGAFVAPELAHRAVAISLEELRAVPRVMAIAAGAGKAGAIRGALATGIPDILVTDRAAATGLLADGVGA